MKAPTFVALRRAAPLIALVGAGQTALTLSGLYFLSSLLTLPPDVGGLEDPRHALAGLAEQLQLTPKLVPVAGAIVIGMHALRFVWGMLFEAPILRLLSGRFESIALARAHSLRSLLALLVGLLYSLPAALPLVVLLQLAPSTWINEPTMGRFLICATPFAAWRVTTDVLRTYALLPPAVQLHPRIWRRCLSSLRRAPRLALGAWAWSLLQLSIAAWVGAQVLQPGLAEQSAIPVYLATAAGFVAGWFRRVLGAQTADEVEATIQSPALQVPSKN